MISVLRKPLLFIDIDLGDDEKEKDRIVVYKEDNPIKLAEDFC
jgi:hypothetical protein